MGEELAVEKAREQMKDLKLERYPEECVSSNPLDIHVRILKFYIFLLCFI